MTGRIRFSAAILAAVGLQLSAAPARGADFAVDPGRSVVDAWVALLIFCTTDCEPNALIEFTGTASAEVTLVVSPPYGVVVESLRITGADLGLSDEFWLVSAGGFLIPTDGSDVRGTLVSPTLAASVSSFGVSTVDLQGASLTIDTGTLIGEHPLPPPLGGPIVHDFAVEPTAHVFGPNTIATASVSQTNPGFYQVEIALPAAASFAIWSTPDPTATFALSEGEIVVTAVVAGPTLGSGVPISNWALIAVGLMLLAIGALKVTSHSIPSLFIFL
jgi:hypothetical protein